MWNVTQSIENCIITNNAGYQTESHIHVSAYPTKKMIRYILTLLNDKCTQTMNKEEIHNILWNIPISDLE